MAYKLNTNNDALRLVLETINALPDAGSGEIPEGYEDVTASLAELNTANGGTEATTMAAAVDNTEALASSQEALIAQIATALEGKAAGGGSSGISEETSEVTIQTCYYVFYTTVEDGELVAKVSTGESTGSTHTITACRNSSVLCGRIGGTSTISGTGAELLGRYETYYTAWKITGDTASIIMTSGHSGGSS